MSQTIYVPFRRQTGSLWILNGGNITCFLGRFNVWRGASWGSRCVVSDTIPQLKVCVVSNTVTSWDPDLYFFSQLLWTSISFSIMVPWQWSIIWQPPAGPQIPTLLVELPPYNSDETGRMLKMVQSIKKLETVRGLHQSLSKRDQSEHFWCFVAAVAPMCWKV